MSQFTTRSSATIMNHSNNTMISLGSSVAAPATAVAGTGAAATASGLTPYRSLPMNNGDLVLQGIADASSRRLIEHYLQAATTSATATGATVTATQNAPIPTWPQQQQHHHSTLASSALAAASSSSSTAAAAHIVPFTNYCPTLTLSPLGLWPIPSSQQPLPIWHAGSHTMPVRGYLEAQLLQRMLLQYQQQQHPNNSFSASGQSPLTGPACAPPLAPKYTTTATATTVATATTAPIVGAEAVAAAAATETTTLAVHTDVDSADMVTTCRPILLAQPSDVDKLSSLQVLLRHQIEAFCATEQHVSTHTRGRTKPVRIGQVGIRCRHCAHIPLVAHQKGSTYFPTTVQGFYQASQNMSNMHLQSGLCTNMPHATKVQFDTLLANKGTAISGAGRSYWTNSARNSLGLVDTNQGIFFAHSVPADAVVVETSQAYQQAVAKATMATTAVTNKRPIINQAAVVGSPPRKKAKQ